MSDKKISQLSSITTPLQSSDIIPIVRTPNTETLKVSYGDLRDAITGSVPAVDLSGLATTQSLNTFTASYVSDSGSVSNRVSQLEATASASTSSLALTASYAPDYLPLSGGIITGDLTVQGTASIQYLHVTYESSSVLYSSGSNQFGDETTDTQLLIGKVVMTGSVEVSGSVNAPDITGSLFGTASVSISSSYSVSASMAQSASRAISASYADFAVSSSYPFTVTGSSIRSYNTSNINANNSNIIGNEAGQLTNNAPYSNMMGYRAGADATNAAYATFIGDQAGYQAAAAQNAVFIGRDAGWQATSGSDSVAIGNGSGIQARRANSFTFVGAGAGNAADGAQAATFVGYKAGQNAISASYSVHLGYRAGYTEAGESGSGYNNIIIGTNVNVGPGQRNSINIGGLLFGSGSYDIPFQAARSAFSGSANGKIGINQPAPLYSLDVSGNARITNGVTASLFGTASFAITASHAITSSYPFYASSSRLYSFNASLTSNAAINIGTNAGNGSSGSANAVLIGFAAGASAQAPGATLIGSAVANNVTEASNSIMIGASAAQQSFPGANFNQAIILGTRAGRLAPFAAGAIMIGHQAGDSSVTNQGSILIGSGSGQSGYNSHSIIIGTSAGVGTTQKSEYNILIGHRAGTNSGSNVTYLNENNIVIGNNLYMPSGSSNALNIGGLIFGSGTQPVPSNRNSSTSGSANGRIGINQPIPEYSLDVSGTFRVTDGMTGSLHGTASWAQNAISSSFATLAISASYLSGSIQTASFAFTASYLEGTASWAINSVTASYVSGTIATASFAFTASEAQNARDILIYVKNDQTSTILKGQVVRISGANGDNALVQTASWDNDALSANTLGIATENIASNAFGQVMTSGKLIGIDTSNFTAGQMLYLGATGSIINYAPTAPLHGVRLGQALRIQGINGSMDVRIDNGYELGELHDVIDTTTNTTYGDLLVRSGSVWTNSRSLTGSYSLTGSLVATSFTGSLDGTASFARNASTASFALTASFLSGSIASASYAVTASNALTASFVSTSIYSRETHVSVGVGSDVTGDGTFLRPYQTISKGLAKVASGEQLIVHPGTYREDITISGSANNFTLVGANTETSGIVYISGSINVPQTISSVRITGIAANTINHTGACNLYLQNSRVLASLTKSSTGYFEVFKSSTEFPTTTTITGTGTSLFINSFVGPTTVNNAAATVAFNNCGTVVQPTVTAGTLFVEGGTVYSLVSGSAAINSSAGTVVALKNTQVLNPNATVARVAIGGFFSVDDINYDKRASTLGTSLNTVAHFQNIEATQVSGSLFGTASWAQNVTTASFALTSSQAISASWAVSSSRAISSLSASYAFTASSAVSSSYALSASYALSSSFSLTSISASVSVTSSHFVSSSMWELNTQTANYVLSLGDAGKMIHMNVGSANTVTVPDNATVPFPIGTFINITQYGTGITTVAASGGVTINSANGWKRINAQYGAATLYKVATNTWTLAGNLNA